MTSNSPLLSSLHPVNNPTTGRAASYLQTKVRFAYQDKITKPKLKGHFGHECNSHMCRNIAFWWSRDDHNYYCSYCAALHNKICTDRDRMIIPAIVGYTYVANDDKDGKFTRLTVDGISGYENQDLVSFLETHKRLAVYAFHKWLLKNKSTIERVNPWHGNI